MEPPEQRCDTCGFAKRLPVEPFVMGLTPVIGFLDDQGIGVLAPSFDEVVPLLQNCFETTAEESFCVTVTIEGEATTLSMLPMCAVVLPPSWGCLSRYPLGGGSPCWWEERSDFLTERHSILCTDSILYADYHRQRR